MGNKAKDFKSGTWNTAGVRHGRAALPRDQKVTVKRGELIRESPAAIPFKASELSYLHKPKHKALYKCLQIAIRLSPLEDFGKHSLSRAYVITKK